MTELPTRQGTITTPPHSEPIVLSGAREEHACCRTVRITKDAVPAYAGGITTVTSQGFHYVALPHTPKKKQALSITHVAVNIARFGFHKLA